MSQNDFYKFGQSIWGTITNRPFGSMTKRELELTLLQAAIDAKLIEPRPSKLAGKCRLTMAKAHGYLTDLALRTEPLEYKEALERLSRYLRNAEIISDDKLLVMSVQDTHLILWIERNLAEEKLMQGETIRRDIIKLSPKAISHLYSAGGHLPTPEEALNVLSKFNKEHWYKEFRKSVKPGLSWKQVLESSAYLTRTILSFFP